VNPLHLLRLMSLVSDKISVVTPCYNEVETICLLIDRIESCLDAEKLSFEVIVVDDGSNDGTLEALREKITNTSFLTVASVSPHVGKAEAMQIGIGLASGEVIVTLDSDLQDQPEEIPKLLKELEHSDFVIGWRKNRRDRKTKTNYI
jgi:glycosyltransferase involved in cell wall biosynthesis